MRIAAHVRSAGPTHEVRVETGGQGKALPVPARPGGGGSSVNGGEFLMLALATCYCNDLYREAARMDVQLTAVEVEAMADFEGIGLAATNIRYRARVESPAPPEAVERLLRATDAVAEVHNTVRAGVPVQLVPWRAADDAGAQGPKEQG